MQIIVGNVNRNVNVRSEPTADTSRTDNIVRYISGGSVFEGSQIEKDSLGREWIKLTSIAGVSVSGMYLAAFISSVDWKYKDIETGGEDLGVPLRVTTVEEFEDGSKRTIVWENPQVSEE